jgi:hypothetical protein
MSVLFQKLKKKASMEKDGEDPGGLVSPLGRKKKAKNSAKQRGTGEDEGADGGGVTS